MSRGGNGIEQGASAIQRQNLPGHETRAFAGQELHRVGQFSGSGDAAEGGVILDFPLIDNNNINSMSSSNLN